MEHLLPNARDRQSETCAFSRFPLCSLFQVLLRPYELRHGHNDEGRKLFFSRERRKKEEEEGHITSRLLIRRLKKEGKKLSHHQRIYLCTKVSFGRRQSGKHASQIALRKFQEENTVRDSQSENLSANLRYHVKQKERK